TRSTSPTGRQSTSRRRGRGHRLQSAGRLFVSSECPATASFPPWASSAPTTCIFGRLAGMLPPSFASNSATSRLTLASTPLPPCLDQIRDRGAQCQGVCAALGFGVHGGEQLGILDRRQVQGGGWIAPAQE